MMGPEFGVADVCRYAVEVGAPEKKRPGKRSQKAEIFSLREDDDGWPSIQDAQNAAATLALFHLRVCYLLCMKGPD